MEEVKKESRVLVIGGTGRLGRWIARASLLQGHPTTLLIRPAAIDDNSTITSPSTTTTTSTTSIDNNQLNNTEEEEEQLNNTEEEEQLNNTEEEQQQQQQQEEQCDDTDFSSKSKADLVRYFASLGATILPGSLEDQESLVEAVTQADVVISAVSQLSEQTNIIKAICEAGQHIQRFIPSEFGVDVDRIQAHESIKFLFSKKAQIRREIEGANIPYSYVCSVAFADYFLRSLGQPGQLHCPPKDKVIIYGCGNTKVSYLCEEDIGTFIIKVAHDPRTLNKVVHLRFPKNILTQNEVIELWEIKSGKTLERVIMQEEDMFKIMNAQPFTMNNANFAMKHAVFVKGVLYNFPLDIHDVDASNLFLDAKYITADEYLQKFV